MALRTPSTAKIKLMGFIPYDFGRMGNRPKRKDLDMARDVGVGEMLKLASEASSAAVESKDAQRYMNHFLSLDMESDASFEAFCRNYGVFPTFTNILPWDRNQEIVGLAVAFLSGLWEPKHLKELQRLVRSEVTYAQEQFRIGYSPPPKFLSSPLPSTIDTFLQEHTHGGLTFWIDDDTGRLEGWNVTLSGKDAIGAAALAAYVLKAPEDPHYQYRPGECQFPGCNELLGNLARGELCKKHLYESYKKDPVRLEKKRVLELARRRGVELSWSKEWLDLKTLEEIEAFAKERDIWRPRRRGRGTGAATVSQPLAKPAKPQRKGRER